MIHHHPLVQEAYDQDTLLVGTIDSWILYHLLDKQHITDPSNASRTLLLDLDSLTWSDTLLEFFDLKKSILPRIVSSSEVYGELKDGPLKGTRISGIAGDQQAALVGNKCFKDGEAKCTYGTGAFLLYCTGPRVVRSSHGLISTIAFQPGPGSKPVYALEGSSKSTPSTSSHTTTYGIPLVTVAVAGSAIQWLRDSMRFIESANQVNALADQVEDTGGVYFVTAFSGLLAPYWDPSASGLLIGEPRLLT